MRAERGRDEGTSGQQIGAEAPGAAGAVAFEDDFAFAHAVDKAHDVLEFALPAHGVFNVADGGIAGLELGLQNAGYVFSALGPFGGFDFDLVLVRLDAVFDLVAGAVEALVQDGGCGFGDGLTREGVGSEGRGRDEPVDVGLEGVGHDGGGETADAEFGERGC